MKQLTTEEENRIFKIVCQNLRELAERIGNGDDAATNKWFYECRKGIINQLLGIEKPELKYEEIDGPNCKDFERDTGNFFNRRNPNVYWECRKCRTCRNFNFLTCTNLKETEEKREKNEK